LQNTKPDLIYSLVEIPKYMLKSNIECLRIVTEKELMLKIDHPHIVKLVSYFHVARYVYFIEEFIKGTRLPDLLPLPIDLVQKYVLYFTSIIEHLHEKGIVYRDFCSENVIVDGNSAPYLYDFGCAKIIKSRTYTRIGNPYYRSPEMILGRGYTKSTDYWSLGVLIYEMAYGYLPFTLVAEDQPIFAYEKILKAKHGIKYSMPEQMNNLILSLLTDSNSRIDSEGIRNHPWLIGFTIDPLLNSPSLISRKSRNFFSPNESSTLIPLEQFLSRTSKPSSSNTSFCRDEIQPFDWDAYF
jgi:serine/threonine protein kinase